MSTPEVQTGRERKQGLRDYNYEHFRTKHFLLDLQHTIQGQGVRPGQEAPDFELESTGGGQVRLSALRGRPVVLHFGSVTWPITASGVPLLRELADRYGDRVRWLDVLVRQAHPGGSYAPYRMFEEKVASARGYKRDEGVPWPVLVDDLAGTVHQAYGGMSDPVYLIDAAGRVAFYGMWTHPPKLKEAIDELLDRGGRGVVASGIDRMPHIVASFVDGWRGVSRGGFGGVLDYELGVPGASTLTFLGEQAKPILGPLALRTTPLPLSARIALGAGLVAGAALALGLLRRGD